MSKFKKMVRLTKDCIKHPKTFFKGFKYLVKNGPRAFKQNAVNRANEELKVQLWDGHSLIQSEEGVWNSGIKFSILIPTYNVAPLWLEKALTSIWAQNYSNWEVCIVDDCSTNEETKKYLREITDNRIKVEFSDTNKGISEATNQAATMAEGDFILLMDNDDVLQPEAFHLFAEKILDTDADIVYSDHDIIDERDLRSNPIMKPDWSPDLINCQMYVGHLLGFKKSLFDEVGGFNSEYNGSQDYDLFLRMSEKTDKIEHVHKVLYSWRSLPSSTATNPESKPYSQTAGLKAVQSHLDRVYGVDKAWVEETDDLFVYDTRYKIEGNPKVSVIIPTKDHIDLLEQCINSIYEKTDYSNYEIIIINNNSDEQESYEYFENVQKEHDNIFVYNIFLEFNWSLLNDLGMQRATGDVYIFLNNDTEVITSDWMTRLAENALREDVGVVGPLLLYEDDTIQHAGIIIGMNSWADHVFKGMEPKHMGTPFVSPMVTRNVLAVTGACLAVSKNTIEKIGPFNENFLICGSDVELGIRAYQNGLHNIYTPFVKLHHYESKSRDSFVPECDFVMSAKYYEPYRGKDPFFNQQLNYMNSTPTVDYSVCPEYEAIFNSITPASNYSVPEATKFILRNQEYPRKRINLLIPSINPENVFGGISTALRFFEELCDKTGFDRRIILVDMAPNEEGKKLYRDRYEFVDCSDDSEEPNQIVPYADRFEKSIPVSENDYFIETGWWTAYALQEAYSEYKDVVYKPNPFIYFIQDYEPGFYPWSSRYVMSEATYRSQYKQIAVFNSSELKNHMKNLGYSFYKEFVFEPVFNAGLKKWFLENSNEPFKKKKQLLIYGRPGTVRNAFELNVMALSEWVWKQEDIDDWNILSAGEDFGDIDLGNGKVLKSLGKLSIEEYAKVLSETFAGISLMVSPHPSYPPLEMATYGVKVITNNYGIKNLSGFSRNIIALGRPTPSVIANKLYEICSNYSTEVNVSEYNKDYVENEEVFPFMDDLVELIKG